jgi:hypothetical protein
MYTAGVVRHQVDIVYVRAPQSLKHFRVPSVKLANPSSAFDYEYILCSGKHAYVCVCLASCQQWVWQADQTRTDKCALKVVFDANV